MVSQIKKEDDDFKTYRIPVQEFVKTFNIKNKNIYKEIEQVTDSLIKKIIKIPIEEWGKEKLFKTSLINSFKYNIDGSGIIEATFHPDLKPYLIQLKNRFLLYDMKHVLNISSSNSIRMYELLKAFEGIGKRTFEVEDLKEILGIEEKYNWRYYNFKKRIILQAQHDLEKHTDITFTFKESKIPWTKKVGSITFFISSKSHNKEKERISTPKVSVRDSNPNIVRLRKYNFSDNVILNEIMKKYDVDFIKNTLDHCEKYFKNNITRNKEWFIIKALEKEFYTNFWKKEKHKELKVQQQEFNQKEEANLKQKEEKKRREMLQKIQSELSEEQLTKHKQQFLEKINNNRFFKLAYQSKGFEHGLIQGQWELFLLNSFS